MKLGTLISIANRGYGDDLVKRCFRRGKVIPAGQYPSQIGDGLAYFVAVELSETFEPDAPAEAQIGEAIRVTERAIEDLQNVLDELEEAARKI